MSLKIITLQSLIDSYETESEVLDILKTFESTPHFLTGKVNDVEDFLHNKAIEFERNALSTTHLIFSEYRKELILVGYFSLANKPLTMTKKNYNSLNGSQKRKLCNHGSKTESGGYIVNSYLLGQLGKNFSDKAIQTKAIDGSILLTIAYDTILEAKQFINAKYVWLECEDEPRLIDLYKKFGFEKINGYESQNGLMIMIMKLKRE